MELNFLFNQTTGLSSGSWDDAEKYNTEEVNFSTINRLRVNTSATISSANNRCRLTSILEVSE